MSNKRITIDDVAKELGLSKTTVSRAISGKGRVSEATREKVRSYIQEHNYRPSVVAQGLAQRRTYNLAVVWPKDTDIVEMSFFQRCLVGISEASSQRGYDVLIAVIAGDDIADLKRIVDNRKVDGVILTRTLVDDPSCRFLQEENVPFVAIGSSPDETVIQVDSDNLSACRELTAILVGKGFSKIALIGGSRTHAVTIQRLQGYREALNQAKVPIDESLIYLDVESTGRMKTIQTRLLEEKVDCVICMDDNLAEKFMMNCHAENIKIPEDVRLASFYNSSILNNAQPPVTSLNFDEKYLGEVTVNTLIDLIEDKPVTSRMISRYEVVLKESTK